jgi:hypothetical protein
MRKSPSSDFVFLLHKIEALFPAAWYLVQFFLFLIYEASSEDPVLNAFLFMSCGRL